MRTLLLNPSNIQQHSRPLGLELKLNFLQALLGERLAHILLLVSRTIYHEKSTATRAHKLASISPGFSCNAIKLIHAVVRNMVGYSLFGHPVFVEQISELVQMAR